MIEIHPSDLDRGIGKDGCPASLVAPEVNINLTHPVSIMGEAIHEFMAKYIAFDIQLWSLWEKYNCDEQEFRILCAIAKRMWAQFEDDLDDVVVEQKLEAELSPDVKLVGTCDIFGYVDGMPIVLDWKTGYVERRHKEQVKGYLLLQACRVGACPEVMRAGILLVRDEIRDIDEYEFPAATIEELTQDIFKAVEHPDIYNPDPENCLYCPRRYECPARKLLLQSAATALVPADGDKFLPDKSLVALYPKAKMLDGYLKEYDAALRGLVREQGPQAIDGGRELAFTKEDRDTIHWTKAAPVIEDMQLDLDEFVTVGKTKLLNAVADGVEVIAATKKASKELFMQRLREAGAVTVKQIEVFGVRKEQKK